MCLGRIIFTPLSNTDAIRIRNLHRLAKVLVASLTHSCLLEASRCKVHKRDPFWWLCPWKWCLELFGCWSLPRWFTIHYWITVSEALLVESSTEHLLIKFQRLANVARINTKRKVTCEKFGNRGRGEGLAYNLHFSRSHSYRMFPLPISASLQLLSYSGE